MLQNFLVSVQAVVPMFIMLLIGMFVRYKNWVTQDDVFRFNRLVFNTLFPICVFHSMYRTTLSQAAHVPLISLCVIATLITFFIALYLFPKLEKDRARCASMIQASYRSNYILMGLPLVLNLYPNADLGSSAIIIALLVPLFNILAIATFEAYAGRETNLMALLKSIMLNPLVLGCIAGILFIPVPVHPIFAHTIAELSASATPIALILLGASFTLKSAPPLKGNVLLCTVGRLLIFPGIFLPIGIFLGFRDVTLAILISVLASPCAISSFAMAQQLGGDADMAGACVIYTSILSCFTMFLWIFMFRQMGFLT